MSNRVKDREVVRVTASLAALALADRLPVSRSFRFHRPRGGFCHEGWCQQCRIATADGPRLACQLSQVEAKALPPGPNLRLVGKLAETYPPWFHERKLPMLLRQPFLNRLRGLSGAPRLAPGAFPAKGRLRRLETDVLVAGGGLSGLSAALALAGHGVRVLLVSAGELGGIARVDPRLEHQVDPLIAKVEAAGVAIHRQSRVVGLYEGPRRALVIDAEGPVILRFERLVVATGAYDRLPALRGNDLPGVVGLRAFARLAGSRVAPYLGRVGAFGDQAALADFAAVAGAHGIVIAWSRAELPLRLAGPGRVQHAVFAGHHAEPADLVVVALRQPDTVLQLQAGQHATVAGSPPLIVARGETRLPLIAVGAAAGNFDAATLGATGFAWDRVQPDVTAPEIAGAAVPHPKAMVCLCEDVRIGDIEQAIADGFDDIELLKRRTGAATGPCQGKLCHAGIAACLARAGRPVAVPTQRPVRAAGAARAPRRGGGMTAHRYDAIVVGAGIFGCALAFELSRRTRMSIAVLDRKHTSAGASSRNVGRVRAFQLTPELTRLSMAAQAKHARLTDDLGHNTLYWRNGYALVLYDADEMEVMAGVQRMLMGDFGLATELLGSDAAVKRMPVLEGGVKPAGALYRQDASAHHDAVMHGYRKALLKRGVTLLEQTPVTGLLRAGDRIEGVTTETAEIRAGLVVNATGAWSRTLSAMAGLEVPNTPLRREAMVTEAVKPFMDTLITFYRPTEGWLNQTLRGEVVMGVVDEKEVPGITLEFEPRVRHPHRTDGPRKSAGAGPAPHRQTMGRHVRRDARPQGDCRTRRGAAGPRPAQRRQRTRLPAGPHPRRADSRMARHRPASRVARTLRCGALFRRRVGDPGLDRLLCGVSQEGVSLPIGRHR